MANNNHERPKQGKARRVLARVDPFPDESARGYLRRVARTWYWADMTWILQIAQLRETYLDLSDFAKPFAYPLRLRTDEWRAIANRRTTTRHRGRFIFFRSKPIKRDHITYQHPRICIECVRENLVERAVWELSLVTACARHDQFLISACTSCGKQLSRFNPHIHLCPCGQDLRELTPRDADVGAVMIARLIEEAALGHRRAQCSSTLIKVPPEVKSLELGDLLEVIRFLGSFQKNGKLLSKVGHFRPTDLQACIECADSAAMLLMDWPVSYSKVLRRNLPLSSIRSLKRMLGPSYLWLVYRLHGDQYRFLRNAFLEIAVEKVPRFSRVWETISNRHWWFIERNFPH